MEIPTDLDSRSGVACTAGSAQLFSSTLACAFHFLRSDEELAAQLRTGDTDALTTLFKRHNHLVFGVARRILRDRTEAEDVVQQIFLDVFRAIEQFDAAKGSFKTWLLMFSYHRALNRRRAMISAHFFETDSFEEWTTQLPQPAKQSFEGLEDRILVQQLLSASQPRQKTTIELTYYEGLTAEEISVRTGESVRVVRHNFYRGLAHIRQEIERSEQASKDMRRGKP